MSAGGVAGGGGDGGRAAARVVLYELLMRAAREEIARAVLNWTPDRGDVIKFELRIPPSLLRDAYGKEG